MNILIGVGLFSVCLLVFSVLFRAMRRPGAGRWLDNEWVATAFAIVLTTTLAMATGQLATGAGDLAAQIAQLGVTEAVGLAIGTAVAISLSVRLIASGRRLSGMASPWQALGQVYYPGNAGTLQTANLDMPKTHTQVA